jgi:hypothetical protein
MRLTYEKGGVVPIMLCTGLFVSQVEAKNDKYDDKDKNQYAVQVQTKHDKLDAMTNMKVHIPLTVIPLRDVCPFPGPYYCSADDLPAW